MPKELTDEERQHLRNEFNGLTKPNKLDIEYDGQALKVVRIGLTSHKEAWQVIEKIIKMGYHIVGLTGNNAGMNQGFVLLERNEL